MAAIDTSTLPSGGNVSEYEITLSKGGKLLRKNRVPCSEKVYTETIGADKVEIVPVYRYENVQNVNNGITLGEFEEGLYNITFKKNGKARCDIYVNGAMVGNNIDQSGEGRKPSSQGRHECQLSTLQLLFCHLHIQSRIEQVDKIGRAHV